MCAITAEAPSLTEVYILPVKMGDKEWGIANMIKIADEQLNLHRDTPYLVVEVIEHAGWWLQFAKINSRTTIVGSANDAADYPDVVIQFHREIRELNTVMLPTITR